MSNYVTKSCSQQEICQANAGSQVDLYCGRDSSSTAMLNLAEDTCPDVLGQKYDLIQWKDRGGCYVAKRDLHLGWRALEFGMQPDLNARESGEYFTEASSYADEVLSSQHANFRISMEAALLNVYLPAFKARRDNQRVSLSEAGELREGLGRIHDAAQLAPIHSEAERFLLSPDHQPCFRSESNRRAGSTLLAAHMLAAREGMSLYPASPREAYKDSGEIAPYAHNAYLVDTDGYKLPMRIGYGKNTQSGLSNEVMPLAMHELMLNSKDRLYMGNNVNIGELLGDLGVWLSAESHGEGLMPTQYPIVSQMSQAFREKVDKFRERYHQEGVLPRIIDLDMA